MGTNITGIGNANAIGFKSRVTGGAYFPPELKDALVGVWSAYGKSNDSTDRNIIKNKIKDRGGDFVISNAAFKLNSGFGKYETELYNTRIWTQSKETTSSPFSSSYNGLSGWLVFANTELTNSADMPSFKIQVKGLLEGQELIYRYYDSNGQSNVYSMGKDGEYTLPADIRTAKPQTSNTSGFQVVKNDTNTITITQIPSFQGAFVTDGIDDLITSTKTVQEMLGGSNEITVVSMMANLDSRQILCNSNFSNVNGYNVRNTLEPNGVISMLGYTDKNGTTNNLNLIMGDKDSIKLADKVNFNSDYVFYPAQYYKAYYQVAWYWTFIANRVLTEDEINLVIEKYNLDRPGEIVKPQVYYDIKRQKITNENHSAFDDKLIDYSGNGYDAKLYNFGWKEDSGIGKYETDFTDWKKSFKVTSFDSESIKFTSDVSWVLLYHPSSIGEDIPSFKVRIKLYGKGTLYYNYITQEGKYTNVAVKSEIFETPICYNTKYTGEKGVNVGFTLGVISGECSGTITQIPEYENALVLDGVDDYGKVTGLPILKDYTVAADYIRTFAKENAQDSPILSKSKVAGSGAFLFNYLNADSITSSYSFGTNNILKEINDSERKIYYLSKYASDGHNVNAGSAVDYDTMWLGTYRDNTSNFFTGALYFAMLFPYSLSEFLLERQIKKARAGTLYPNTVEFRPIIPEDENITRIDYFVVNSGTWTVIKPGDYVDVGTRIVINVYTKFPYKVEKVSSLAFTGMSVGPSTRLNAFDVKGYIKDKTPQKIKLTLAVNEDIVQWNPAITSNLLDSFTVSSWYLNGWDNTLTAGTWIKKTDRVFFKATFKTELYGLETATFGGTECVVSKADNWSDSKNIWDIRMLGTVGDLSQVFNLDVYELIRFEDIVQPYPLFFEFTDENGNLISWGGKAKVGSTITRTKGVNYANLLEGLFTVTNPRLNGVPLASAKHIVEKSMVFTCTATWAFDNNGPKCILSPSRLRIPNSSYKILGHIPDISGHGNHGKINNSAYAEGSGVNEDGSYQFDGVDDFVTIPTLSSGGKQVLMKVNWNTINSIIYDQRGSGGFAIYCSDYNNPSDSITVPAYKGRNAAGTTYIDGIRNEYIIASQLRNVTHNIVEILDTSYAAGKTNPIIGKSHMNSNYGSLALYDFMLFDNISTDDKIKELNEYVGIEGNIVEWNPTITSNIPYKDMSTYITTDGTIDSTPKVGNLYKKGDKLTIGIKPVKDLDEVGTVIINGVKIKRSSLTELGYYIYDTVLDSTQIIDITIDEYIKYEDIVQPYPSLFTLINYDTEEVYSWGSKLKIGAKFKGNVANLLPDMYEWQGDVLYNGEPIYWNTTPGVVAKEMVFSWNMPFKYLKTNAPKCIFSPSKLRMPNESYRYLGYIPDISGNGNNGVFNNFAFSKMSGADGYPYDYKSTSDFVAHARNAVLVNSETVKFINVLTQTSFYYKGTSYKGKIKVTGITKAIASGKVRYLDIYSNSPTNNDRVIIDKDGIYDVNIETEDAINIFFYLTPIVSGTTALDEPVYLEQVGNYEGSICFDGVDDYMDIPSLSIGGKQVLMKTNWLKSPTLLYDQRASGSFAILATKEDDATNPRIAYQARNQDGKTYIDGIENNYIETYSLKGITHNITVTNPSAGSGVVPVIGANTGKSSSFAKMALYDFMLFDEVSTNEEIKQLNDIVGIEGNYVQRPPYYWDTHGKSNLDGDRGTIPQLGTAEDYSFTSFDNEIDWYLSSSNYIDVVSRNGYKITLKNLSTGIDGWRFQNSTVKRFILNDIPFKIKSNKTIRVYWDMYYNAISSTELRQKVVSVTTINPNEDTLINLRHLTEEELTELNVNKSTMYYLLWFDVSTLAVNEEVTIEMLPVEGGRNLWLNNYGFAYDKMSGYEGYSFKSFSDSQSWNIRGDSTGVEIISRNGYSMTVKKLVQNLDWQISNNEYRYPTILDKEVPFKCKSNKNVGLIWQLKYKTEGATSDTTVTLINQQLTPNVPLEISLPYKTQDELTELGAVSTSVYYLLYFSNTLLEIGEEYTVEMLPLYPNGLVLDGVDDYSENASIPLLSDYTYIFKRTLLNKKYNSASIFKGSNKQSGGGAFICDYNSVEPDLLTQGFSFGAGLYVDSLNADSIVYGTRGSVNGTKITAGNNTDTEGLTVGKWRAYKEMVFYKLFLYPRTVNMLSINMVKNMMEEDGIIDLTSKLFTDKYTGDFYEMDFNNDFLIGN